MTQLLERALEEVRKLPPDDQDAIASIILEEIQDESKWARIVRRVEANPIDLGSYSEQDRRDRKQFRDETLLQHDRS